jgi:hypothetical protein
MEKKIISEYEQALSFVTPILLKKKMKLTSLTPKPPKEIGSSVMVDTRGTKKKK